MMNICKYLPETLLNQADKWAEDAGRRFSSSLNREEPVRASIEAFRIYRITVYRKHKTETICIGLGYLINGNATISL